MIERRKGWKKGDGESEDNGVSLAPLDTGGILRNAGVLKLEDARLTVVEVVKRDVSFIRSAIMRGNGFPAGPGNEKSFRMTGFESDHHREVDKDQTCGTDMKKNGVQGRHLPAI